MYAIQAKWQGKGLVSMHAHSLTFKTIFMGAFHRQIICTVLNYCISNPPAPTLPQNPTKNFLLFKTISCHPSLSSLTIHRFAQIPNNSK